MEDFTTTRPDGFGSQMNAMLVGYLVAEQQGCKYFYTPFQEFRLLKVGSQNKQLQQVNEIVANMVVKLGIHAATKQPNLVRPMIYSNDDTFRGPAAEKLKTAWPLSAPPNGKICVIHVRRGDDIDPSMKERWQSDDFVNDLIKRCMKVFPDHTIKIVSWKDPGIDPTLEVVKDISTDGGDILTHFNMMVHADVLVLAHSSFSLSAGLLNKNTVICPPSILRTKSAHHPKEWDDNWKLLDE